MGSIGCTVVEEVVGLVNIPGPLKKFGPTKKATLEGATSPASGSIGAIIINFFMALFLSEQTRWQSRGW
jgi:hypothetical protein